MDATGVPDDDPPRDAESSVRDQHDAATGLRSPNGIDEPVRQAGE